MYIFRKRISKKRRGESIIEGMIAVLLVGFMGVGIISTILLTRHMAEFDKQRIAAISAARDYIEQNRRELFPASEEMPPVRLDDFNTPTVLTDDLNATVRVDLYLVNPDGTRGEQIQSTAGLNDTDLVEVVVRVEWNRTGRLSSHRVSEELSTYRIPDL
ncbi:hypothetical protein J7M23_12380 [Candidatus Sumerlaeota bacterium]|nr:hypothetical protein [Candidatus Sumerlaeota bacterium]